MYSENMTMITTARDTNHSAKRVHDLRRLFFPVRKIECFFGCESQLLTLRRLSMGRITLSTDF